MGCELCISASQGLSLETVSAHIEDLARIQSPKCLYYRTGSRHCTQMREPPLHPDDHVDVVDIVGESLSGCYCIPLFMLGFIHPKYLQISRLSSVLVLVVSVLFLLDIISLRLLVDIQVLVGLYPYSYRFISELLFSSIISHDKPFSTIMHFMKHHN